VAVGKFILPLVTVQHGRTVRMLISKVYAIHRRQERLVKQASTTVTLKGCLKEWLAIFMAR